MQEESPQKPSPSTPGQTDLAQPPPHAVPVDVSNLPPYLREKFQSALLSVVAVHNSTTYRSPLPPPEILDGYKRIDPTLLDRIVTMAERNGEHLRRTEHREQTFKAVEIFMGQIFALLVALAFLGAGGYLVYSGHDVGGGFVTLGGVGTIITRFILGRDGLKKRALTLKPEKSENTPQDGALHPQPPRSDQRL